MKAILYVQTCFLLAACRPSTHRAPGLQADEHPGQPGAADVIGQQAVGVPGLGHGQHPAPETTADQGLPKGPGLRHQQVVALLRLPQAQEHYGRQG